MPTLSSNSRQLVIRADASLKIGGGHVQRCLSLAQALRAHGWRCALMTGPDTAGTVLLPDWLERIETPRPADLLIVDHYGLAADWEKQARSWARRVMVIDDLADRPHDCDLLLDQATGRSELDYRSLVPAPARLLLGPDYAILRPAFAELRERALKRRAEPGRKLLINFGAADPLNVARQVLSALAATGARFDAEVISGASSEHLPGLRALAATMPGRIAVHGQVAIMAELMAEADLAIGAAGSASWERCALGLPSIILTLADNQAQNASTLAAAGAAKRAVIDDVASVALSLLGDETALISMSARAAALCDGQGAGRVAQAVETMIDTGSSHGRR